MKIAIVVRDFSISGGTHRQALELAKYLMSKKHDVKLYCTYLDTQACYPDLITGLDITSLYTQNRLARLRLLGKIFFYLKAIFAREARREVALMDKDFDVVNCHVSGRILL